MIFRSVPILRRTHLYESNSPARTRHQILLFSRTENCTKLRWHKPARIIRAQYIERTRIPSHTHHKHVSTLSDDHLVRTSIGRTQAVTVSRSLKRSDHLYDCSEPSETIHTPIVRCWFFFLSFFFHHVNLAMASEKNSKCSFSQLADWNVCNYFIEINIPSGSRPTNAEKCPWLYRIYLQNIVFNLVLNKRWKMKMAAVEKHKKQYSPIHCGCVRVRSFGSVRMCVEPYSRNRICMGKPNNRWHSFEDRTKGKRRCSVNCLVYALNWKIAIQIWWIQWQLINGLN